MDFKYHFQPVGRFTTPAPIPYIMTEKDLPSNQKILVFLPHSDDGRYFGCSLYLMNKKNDIRIVVMSPGYHGVDDNISFERKIELRWKEVIKWSETLSFRNDQILNFRADNTYNTQQIDKSEMMKLNRLIEVERPSMVFMPHISDTAQAINYNTRNMVMESIVLHIGKNYKKNLKTGQKIFVVEYPTNHVPFLPPSDKNFIVTFSDPTIANVKHKANEAHASQSMACIDITGKFVEAVEAISEAETLHQMHKRRRYAECLSGVEINPRTSRSEHFGITLIKIKKNTDSIIEERLEFPLSKDVMKLWKY
jgi:LmbE family N-acetylglucosaminyl deacetylase